MLLLNSPHHNMSDKPFGFLVAAFAFAPICVVCAFRPAAIGGLLGGWFEWLADLSLGQVARMSSVAAMIGFGTARLWRTQRIDRVAAIFRSKL